MSDTSAVSSFSLPDQPMLDLRARAEQRLRLEARPADELSLCQSQWLVQELQVHQVELEALNEELLDAQVDQFRAGMEAATALGFYQDLFDAAPVAYLTLDAEGVLAQVNRCAAQLLGTTVARLVGRRFLQFVAPASRADFVQFCQHCLGQEHVQRAEIALLTEASAGFRAQVAGVAARPSVGSCLVRLVLTSVATHAAATTPAPTRVAGQL